jgi:hypothetical protein
MADVESETNGLSGVLHDSVITIPAEIVPKPRMALDFKKARRLCRRAEELILCFTIFYFHDSADVI